MKYVAATALAGLIFGLVLRYFGGGEPVGNTMLVALVALPLLGFLITLDDDLPGGFSNPDGKAALPWTYWENWADLLSRAAIAGIGFAIDSGWLTSDAIVPWAVGLLGVIASLAIHKRIDAKGIATAG